MMLPPNVNPNMKQALVQTLPAPLAALVDATMAILCEIQREDYQESALHPFAHMAQELKAQGKAYFTDLYAELLSSQVIIDKEFRKQEELEHQSYPEEASFATWKNSLQTAMSHLTELPLGSSLFDLSLPLQEALHISWPLMDRLLGVAQKLLHEGEYVESKAVFQLLAFLQPQVFAYRFGLARCLQLLGNFEEALRTYLLSLVLEPKNPDSFFQIASCYFSLQDTESCKRALELCVEYAKDDPKYSQLQTQAMRIQEALVTQRAA